MITRERAPMLKYRYIYTGRRDESRVARTERPQSPGTKVLYNSRYQNCSEHTYKAFDHPDPISETRVEPKIQRQITIGRIVKVSKSMPFTIKRFINR